MDHQQTKKGKKGIYSTLGHTVNGNEQRFLYQHTTQKWAECFNEFKQTTIYDQNLIKGINKKVKGLKSKIIY